MGPHSIISNSKRLGATRWWWRPANGHGTGMEPPHRLAVTHRLGQDHKEAAIPHFRISHFPTFINTRPIASTLQLTDCPTDSLPQGSARRLLPAQRCRMAACREHEPSLAWQQILPSDPRIQHLGSSQLYGCPSRNDPGYAFSTLSFSFRVSNHYSSLHT